MIVLNASEYPQGSEAWLQARCGVATASRFRDAREKTGGLTPQQETYVNALKLGKSEAEAMRLASYKAKPTSQLITKALAGENLYQPSQKALDYAWLIAMETVARKPLDDTFVTYAMRRGRELEPQARRVYEKRTGAIVEEASLVLTDDSRFGYSTDGLRDDDERDGPGMVEIKVPLACEKVGNVWAHPETAHLEYIDQINGGLWITGRKWCDLIVYCDWLKPVGKDLFFKRIYRDEAAIEALEADLVAFWALVEANLAILRTATKMTGKRLNAEEAAAPAPVPEAEPVPAKTAAIYDALADIPEQIF